MSNEEIALYSDIVKLGFPVLGTVIGGVIGALSTYFITKQNHKNENANSERQQRVNLILQASNDIAEFEHLMGVYTTGLSNHIRKLDGAFDIEEPRLAVINNTQMLRRARMTIKILGLKDAELYLEEYLELTREVIAYGPKLKVERIKELAPLITRGPVKFYESLTEQMTVK